MFHHDERLPFDTTKVPCYRIPGLVRALGGLRSGSEAGRRVFLTSLREARRELASRRRCFSPEYPDLPVVSRREEFLRLLANHRVVIVQADTGSGKSTQIPKFLLETGLSDRGRIGVTQPRRIAALTIADRLRDELHDDALVGTRIRFLEEGPADARIKVMTDGILLQEYRRDRLFNQYSCILLDEAHERSLNIDILLGILRTVVERRPDFRLVIASATMDARLFADFFPGSAVLEAEGRLFPVEVEYRTPESGAKGRGDSGLVDEAAEAVLDLLTSRPDHLLCFLPTERDITELADRLRKDLDERRFDLVPLFGRLSPADQKRAFRDSGKVRVVLATNIAETSLTIPGIAYVVDTGSARISRYSASSRIQGLPVEPISQAAAEQRKGRAGRVKPGRCIRLYAPEDLARRPAFTEPEVLRSNLSNVVLQLRDLGLREEEFAFLQSPPRSAFRGACKHLHELGALSNPDSTGEVTTIGREMAKLPIDVSLAAVLLQAREHGSLQPAIAVCSALCILDPRIVPSEEPERTRARERHRSWGGKGSDFLALLAVWNRVADLRGKEGGLGPLRRFCEENWVSFLRVREWTDLYEQFCRILKVEFASRSVPEKSFNVDSFHRSLLAGFLGTVACKSPEGPCYKLAGGREAFLFPGSELAKKGPKWVVAAEVRETSRVFLNKVCEVRTEWIEAAAGELCTKRWYQPFWNRERGFVEAMEEVSFRGLVLSRGRPVDYARIDPDACAQIFWHEAIVEGDVPRPFPFMQANQSVLAGLSDLEKRLRRHGIRPSPDALANWYAERCPDVSNLPALREWIAKHGDTALRLDPQVWINSAAEGVDLPEFKSGFSLAEAAGGKSQGKKDKKSPIRPGQDETWKLFGRDVRVHLVFDHSDPLDGISLEIPLDLWAKLTPAGLAREIPAWRGWMLDALLGGLPQKTRERALPLRAALDEEWLDRLTERPEEAPALLLLEAFRAQEDMDAVGAGFDDSRLHHLRLHIRLQCDSTEANLELSPAMDLRLAFVMVREVLSRALGPRHLHAPFPTGLPGLVWGVAPASDGKVVRNLMPPAEAELRLRLANHLRTGQNLASGEEGAPLRDLLSQRLGSLEGPAGDLSPGGSSWRTLALLGSWCGDGAMPTRDGLLLAVPTLPALAERGGVRLHDLSQLSGAGSGPERNARAAVFALCLYAAPYSADLFRWYWKRAVEAAHAYAHGKSAGPTWEQAAAQLHSLREQDAESLDLSALSLALECANKLGWEGSLALPSAEERETLQAKARARRKGLRNHLRPLLAHPAADSAMVKKLRETLSALEDAPTGPGAAERELAVERASLALRLSLLEEPGASSQSQVAPAVDDDAVRKLRERFGKVR